MTRRNYTTKKELKKQKKIIKILLFLVCILILIIIFLSIKNNHIDIYNININTIDNKPIKNKSKENGSFHDFNNIIPTFSEKEDKNVFGNVFIDDENGNYIIQQNLKIFKNKIAPGSKGNYKFKVHNSMSINLNYKITTYEESKYKINMKYRLKRNGKFIIDKYVSSNNLNTKYMNIKSNQTDEYELYWMWDDSDDALDTLAGKNMKDEYKLNIRFRFEEALS